MDVLGPWTIRVCAHGHRVEYRENYGGWLHMDAGSDVCKSAEPPAVVCVTTDVIEREWMRLRASEIVTANPGLSLSDAEEAAVSEWDRGMADREARRSREAVVDRWWITLFEDGAPDSVFSYPVFAHSYAASHGQRVVEVKRVRPEHRDEEAS